MKSAEYRAMKADYHRKKADKWKDPVPSHMRRALQALKEGGTA